MDTKKLADEIAKLLEDDGVGLRVAHYSELSVVHVEIDGKTFMVTVAEK